MSLNDLLSRGAAELVSAALGAPLFSLLVATVIALALDGLQRKRRREATETVQARRALVEKHYRVELLTLGCGAIGVVAVFTLESIARGYLLNLAMVVTWWQFATPLVAACLCIAIVGAKIALRGSGRPETPVLQSARRTWLSFGPRGWMIGASIAFVGLLVTTLTAGVASSPDDHGRYVYLEIPVPNEPVDPLRVTFYGWAYGLPVMACLALLVAVTWATLRRNALRPYRRPDTMIIERQARHDIAAGVMRVALAGILLSLGGAFRLIGRAISVSWLTTGSEGQQHTYQTKSSYSGLAAALGWLAPALEITAFVVLLLTAGRLLRVGPDTLTERRIRRDVISEPAQ